MALHLLLRPRCFRSLCLRLHPLHIPFRSRWSILRRLVLAHLWLRLLLHRPLRRRTRLSLPHIGRSLLHHQIPRSHQLDPRNSLVDGMAQFARSGSWSCQYGIWVRTIATSSCVNEWGFQWLRPHRQTDCGRHGSIHHSPRGSQFAEYVRFGKDDQDIRDIPHCSAFLLLRRFTCPLRPQT